MSLKGLTTIIFFSCWGLCLVSPKTEAYGPLNYPCCVRYTRKPLQIHDIVGFAIQSSLEVCRIDAIIFLTKQNSKICANMQDDWVRNLLGRLSYKVKKMSAPPHKQVNKAAARSTTTSP